jgi:hypothetical protein
LRQDDDLSDACPHYLVGVSSSIKYRRQTPLGDSCMKIAESGGIRSCTPMFFYNPLVQSERCEALLVVTIMGHALLFHGEVSWRRMSWKPRSED